MPGTDITAAMPAADWLRRARTSPYRSPAITERIVTVSVGDAAAVPASDRAVEHLVKTADVQLYRAKRSGRNCLRGALTA